jgi:putative SOS response-associated peptidase YedK
VRDDAANQLRVMRWGLVPHWAKDDTAGARMINARAETVLERPNYRPLVSG